MDEHTSATDDECINSWHWAHQPAGPCPACGVAMPEGAKLVVIDGKCSPDDFAGLRHAVEAMTNRMSLSDFKAAMWAADAELSVRHARAHARQHRAFVRILDALAVLAEGVRVVSER